MKSLKLYCIVDKKNPKLKYLNLIQCSDKNEVRIKKDEKIIPVEVVTIKK